MFFKKGFRHQGASVPDPAAASPTPSVASASPAVKRPSFSAHRGRREAAL